MWLLKGILFLLRKYSSVQLLSRVQLFATPWTAARQASLSITNSWGLLKLMSMESVMPSNHLILCCPLLLLPPIPPSIRVFSSESTLEMQIETTMRYHLIPIRMAIIKKSTNIKCWRGCGKKGTLLYCWWECKLVRPLCRTVWRFLKKLKIEWPLFLQFHS